MTKPTTVAIRDALIAALRERVALSAGEACEAIGMNPAYYGTVYSNLRAMDRKGEVIWNPARGRSLSFFMLGPNAPKEPYDLEALWVASNKTG